MVDSSKLVAATMVVREQNQDIWHRFIIELAAYSSAMNEEMLRSPPELVLKAQGMSLAIRDLVVILNKAPETYDKMRANQHARASHERNGKSWTA